MIRFYSGIFQLHFLPALKSVLTDESTRYFLHHVAAVAVSVGNKSIEANITLPSCKSVPPGSVPSAPGGGAFSTRLRHHAAHRCLHPLCVHRRRQDPTDASPETQRFPMGEEEI